MTFYDTPSHFHTSTLQWSFFDIFFTLGCSFLAGVKFLVFDSVNMNQSSERDLSSEACCGAAALSFCGKSSPAPGSLSGTDCITLDCAFQQGAAEVKSRTPNTTDPQILRYSIIKLVNIKIQTNLKYAITKSQNESQCNCTEIQKWFTRIPNSGWE